MTCPHTIARYGRDRRCATRFAAGWPVACRSLQVMFAVCLVLFQTSCRKDRVSQPAPAKPSSTEQIVRDEPVSSGDRGSDIDRLKQKRNELEGRAAGLRHRIAELREANRRLVEKFQQREAKRTIFGVETESDGREAVVAGNGVAYVWDEPGGYGTGANVVGQVRTGESIVVVNETVMRGQRWYEIYTTSGTAFKSGWTPADAVAPVPTSGNKNE